VELNPVVHEEICTQTFELPVVRERQQRENNLFSGSFKQCLFCAAVSGRDGKTLGKCRTKILINGKEQEVDSKEINWRWP